LRYTQHLETVTLQLPTGERFVFAGSDVVQLEPLERLGPGVLKGDALEYAGRVSGLEVVPRSSGQLLAFYGELLVTLVMRLRAVKRRARV